MSGPWEDFGGKKAPGPWDDFASASDAPKGIGAPEELTTLERIAASLPDWMAGSGGGVRGSAVGRIAMGAADPGVAAVQLAANAVGLGDPVNKRIAEVEGRYQGARGDAGSSGFDPMRMAGNVVITAPAGMIGKAATTLGGMALKGAAQGAVFGGLNPVTDASEGFWGDKAGQVGAGAAGGTILAPVAGALGRLVSPKASINPNLELLRAEGVKPTIGQSLGGMANKVEEKMQSVPIVGDAISAARSRASDQLRQAAINRAAKPIGAKITGEGGDAVAELSAKIGAAYDEVLPKMSVNVMDGPFFGKLSTLREGVRGGLLPQSEKEAFDAIIEREVGQRISPNGTLSGQGLKDAWMALRDSAQTFKKSPDGFQQKLGDALKQAFEELKTHVTASNRPADVIALKNADLAWANFKRVQRAAGAIGAPDGNFSPAQLQSAVKALDRSKDKARFAEGNALMQDLSGAGKSILTGKEPDSGTAGRMMWGAGALASGVLNPAIPAALIGGAAAYAPPVQNALVALLTRRPELAPLWADYIRRLSGPLGVAGGIGAVGMQR